MPLGLANSGSANTYAQLRNNAAPWWFMDAGMRKLSLAICVGFMSTINGGYDGSLINGLLANPAFVQSIDNPDDSKLGIISAAYPLGGLIGIFPAPWIADKFGRRAAIAVGALLIIIGGVIQTATSGGWAMLGGRLVVGVGSSFQGIGGGPLVAEVSHPRNRAQCTALINTCWYIGSIIAAWVTFGALNISGSWSYRLCLLIQVVPCAIQLLLLGFIEESPRWLVAHGREEKALQVLAKYHANGDEQDELVKYEFAEIKEAIAAEEAATEGISIRSFIKTKGNRHRLLILVCVAFFSQWVGNGIISYYLAKILTSVGITDPTAQAGFNGGLQIYNWLLAIAGSLASERLGRRFLWLTSAVGMLASFAVIMACSAVYAQQEIVAAGRAVMAFLFIYFGFYDIAFTGLTVSYPLEILPFSLRAKGMAILNFFIYLALFFNQFVNPIALNALAWKYYAVYIAVLIFSIVMIYFYYPETKGLMLEEVAEIFDGARAVLPVTQHPEQVLDDVSDDKKGLGETEEVEHARR